MTRILFRMPAISAMFVVAAVFSWQAMASDDAVQFPENYEGGVHYGTVNRGNIREELYTSREAIEAAKKGQPFPSGTVITLVDYRDDRLHRYVVMEKRTGWGEQHPANIRTGDWKFAAFNADKSRNASEDGTRCMGCHKPQADQDFVFTVEQMKGVN